MVLRAGIEIGLGARYRRNDALILLAAFPPRCVVVGGLDLAAENLPAPLVDQQAERQNATLSSALRSSSACRRSAGTVVEQADLVQILGRHRQRDGVADGFVEAVVGAVLEQERLVLVGALVEVVAQLVMDGDEILAADLDAHLQAQIVLELSMSQALAWHTTSRSRGLTNSERSQKVLGSGAKPSDLKKPSP